MIVVLDGSKEADQQDQELLEKTADKNRIIVYNKKDISQAPSKEGIWISAANGEIDALIKEIHRCYDEHLIVLKEPSLANDRQIALMMKAQQAMAQAITAMEAGMELDLVAIDIQEAYSALKEILGEVHRRSVRRTVLQFLLRKINGRIKRRMRKHTARTKEE